MTRIDWKTIRYAQKELGIRKRISLEEFKNRWVKHFGPPQSDQERRFLEEGIKDFYEDYMTSTSPNLVAYFESITESAGATAEHIE